MSTCRNHLELVSCSLCTVNLPSYHDHNKEREILLPKDYVNEKKDHLKTHLSLELLYANNYLCCRSMIKRHIMEVYFLYFTSLWKLNYKESTKDVWCVSIVYALCLHCIICLHRVCFVFSCTYVSTSCLLCVFLH